MRLPGRNQRLKPRVHGLKSRITSAVVAVQVGIEKGVETAPLQCDFDKIDSLFGMRRIPAVYDSAGFSAPE
ncbi:hypothetical protein GCM10011496_24370 [Polaromonas eurypsychrophila]|uniref:Uncharacterized protein n=1 Tax=Polaromonas eurypsychrophila TaxID=1614635 RepID=A0A916WJ43_9BURK|nr:hypothetical protein GCM10011496_24370 [Polaromonas eurypsychrophila]